MLLAFILYPLVVVWMNHRRQVPGFYMGDTSFTTITKCWFYTYIAKGLFNTLCSIISQLFSKTIDSNTFYHQRGAFNINGQRGVSLVSLGDKIIPLGGHGSRWGTRKRAEGM